MDALAHRKVRIAFVVVGTLLISYLLLLLLLTYVNQNQLRHYQQQQFTHRIESYARELELLLVSSRVSLESLTQETAVHNYLSQRALRLSLNYRLVDSPEPLVQRLQQAKVWRVSELLVFKQLFLVDGEQVIATSEATVPPLLVRRQWQQQPSATFIAATPSQGLWQRIDIRHPDQQGAELYAQLMPSTLMALLQSQESIEHGSRITLMDSHQQWVIWNSLADADSHAALYSQRIPVADSTLWIEGHFSPPSNGVLISSHWFLMAISLLGVGMTVGFGLLLSSCKRNLVLTTQLSTGMQQRQQLAEQNQQLAQEIALRQQSERDLAYQAHYDSLTGLINRVRGQQLLQQTLERAQHLADSVLLLLFDLDNFKHINDARGHQMGDKLLIQCSERLQNMVLTGATLARFGGDVFFCVVPHLTHSEDAEWWAQQILQCFDVPFTIDNHDFFVSTSIGMALYPQDGQNAAELLQRADVAMNQVKMRGRNGYHFYEQRLDVQLQRRILLDNKLRQALANQTLEVYYQPIMDLQQQRLMGAEALARWFDPELGEISPVEFIPLAERNGLIGQLGEQVLVKSCHAAAQWQIYGPLTVSVNVSSAQFKHYDDLAAGISQCLQQSGLLPQRLIIELTESVLVGNIDELVVQLRQLVEMGLSLAIDDFGTGYSSLSYLQQFPFVELKIDRSFLTPIQENGAHSELVRAILAMAHTLGMTVVTEGIEQTWQAELLTQLGCQLGQGYLYGKAMPEADFMALVQKLMASSRALASPCMAN
ncbi:MAG: EAL domain-containing protein [Ferrimonas sp.]